MNRFELFIFLLCVFVATVYTLRSRWFDRFIAWVFGGPHNKAKETDKNNPVI